MDSTNEKEESFLTRKKKARKSLDFFKKQRHTTISRGKMHPTILILLVLCGVVVISAEYIPNAPLPVQNVQPYCPGGCAPRTSPIIIPKLPHSYDPSKIPPPGSPGGFDEWPTTAAAAAAAGWTVPSTCVPSIGRLATFNADPTYPMQLRYDSAGYLAGFVFISLNPMNFPFEVRGGYFGAAYSGPLWVADTYFRDPSAVCTNGGATQITKLIFREVTTGRGDFEISTDADELQHYGWFDTYQCIPYMGVHLVWIPKGPPAQAGPSNTNGPVDLTMVFSVDRKHLTGLEFTNQFDALAPPAVADSFPTPDVSKGVWEIDAPRPNKNFISYALHIFIVPFSCPFDVNGAPQCPAGTELVVLSPSQALPSTLDLACFILDTTGATPTPYPYGFPPPLYPGANTVRTPPDPRWRTYDGYLNNEGLNPPPNELPAYWGIPGAYGRKTSALFEDGISIPRNSGLPNPRVLSNTIFAAPQTMTTSKINDMHTYHGMLMTTDLCSSARDNYNNMVITVPACDIWKDPLCTGTQTMVEVSGAQIPGTGLSTSNPRQVSNDATSYLDMSFMYGTSGGLNMYLRTFQDGQLNDLWYEQAIGITTPFGYNPFARAGDIRMNKSPPLAAFHKIWRREHNRKALELKIANPSWSDEELFQNARMWTIAVYQAITIREYTAALLGEPLPPYQGYNVSANPTTVVEFCHAAFRYGHSEINKIFMRMDQNFEQDITSHILMRDVLWSQAEVNRSGIEPILRGMITQQQSAADLSFIDDVRQFYANGPADGLDLPAINVGRGRNVGIGTYNDVRIAYGLVPKTSWDEITPDTTLQAQLESLYGTAPGGIDKLDLYVGALAEPQLPSSSLGETFWPIVRDQLIRLRDGDRYWFENPFPVSPDLNLVWGSDNISAAQSRKLEDVIEENSAMQPGEMGSGIFFLKSRTLEALSAAGAFDQVALADNDLALGFTEETGYKTGAQYNIYWRMDGNNLKNPETTITFMLKGKATGWFGIGFNPDHPGSMKGADLYFCRVFDNNGTAECRDSFALDVGPPRLDGDTGIQGCIDSLYYGVDLSRENADPRYFGGYQDSAETTVWFTRRLSSGGDPCDKDIPYNGLIQLIFAFNPNTDEIKYHGPTRSATQEVNVFSGIYEILEEAKTPVGLLVALGIAGALGVLMCIALIILIALMTDHFRFMAPSFCYCILAGAIVCYSAMFTLLENPVTTASCTVYIWLAGVGFAFMFACLFAKTFRVWRLLSSKSMKAHQISTADLAIWIGLLVLLEIIFLAIWTGVDTPAVKGLQTEYDDTKMSYYCECDDGWWGAYAGIYGAYILAGVFFTILTRNLPPEFNDSKAIGWSMYNLALIWAMAVGLGFGLQQWQAARVAVMAFTIFCALTFTILALFGPTVWRIIQKKDPRTFKTTINMGSSRHSAASSRGSSASTSGPTDSTLDD